MKPNFSYYFGEMIDYIRNFNREILEEISMLENDDFYNWRNGRLRLTHLGCHNKPEFEEINMV